MTHMECIEPDSNAPLAQGDIFIWSNWSDRSSWDQLGILLTADCDIVQGKTPGFLTYVPLIPLSAYVNDVWARKRLDKILEKQISEFSEFILRIRLRTNSDATKMSRIAIERWVLSSNTDEIVRSLEVTEAKDQSTIIRYVDVISMLLKDVDAAESSNLLPLLKTVNEKLSSRPGHKVEESIRKEANGALKNPPQDIFFVCDIPGLPNPPFDVLGFFALLRYISPVEIACIATSRPGTKELYNLVFPRAERMARKKGRGKNVALLCVDDELFQTYLKAGNYRKKFVAITSRDELPNIRYAGKRFIFSKPEYVAGLQFEAVCLVEVNNDIGFQDNDEDGEVGLRRRFVSQVYLGASRAEMDLEIYGVKERGGLSDILKHAREDGALRTVDAKQLPSI